MLWREIIAVCSQIHIKHIKYTVRAQLELLNVKPDGNTATSGRWRGSVYYSHRFNQYRAVNTLRLGYKNQPVNVV